MMAVSIFMMRFRNGGRFPRKTIKHQPCHAEGTLVFHRVDAKSANHSPTGAQHRRAEKMGAHQHGACLFAAFHFSLWVFPNGAM
jgi:hypothetical protein